MVCGVGACGGPESILIICMVAWIIWSEKGVNIEVKTDRDWRSRQTRYQGRPRSIWYPRQVVTTISFLNKGLDLACRLFEILRSGHSNFQLQSQLT